MMAITTSNSINVNARRIGIKLDADGFPPGTLFPSAWVVWLPMSNTIYATFANPDEAEKAAGALLDHGVRPEDLSLVRQEGNGYSANTAPQTYASNVAVVPTDLGAGAGGEIPAPGSVYGVNPPIDDTVARTAVANGDVVEDDDDIEDVAKHGITTTTAGDAGAGAVKGTVIGAGIGAIAAIAAMVVPGVGLVIGAGALASAIAGIAASAGAGAAAGAIVGYLKDMGVDDQVASEYGEAVQGGGAVLAVTVPSGNVDEAEAQAVLSKYAATNVNKYASRGYVS